MQANGYRKFCALYGKEMRELSLEIIIVTGLAAVVNLYLFFRLNHTPYIRLLIVPNLMLLGLAGFLPFLASFKLINREWKSNTVYMLLSLPVRGASVLGAKAAALLTQYIAGTMAVGISAALLSLALAGPEIKAVLQQLYINPGVNLNQLLGSGVLFYLLSMAGLLYLVSISFGSQIAGHLVRSYSGLVTLLVFVALLYIVQYFGGLLAYQFSPYFLTFLSNQWTVSTFNKFLLLSTIGLVVASAVIYLGTVWVYNRRIEL
jgi:hypothetical protein